MFWRALSFLAFLLSGGLIGHYAQIKAIDYHAPLLGVLAAVLLWFVIDAARASRLLKLLRAGGLSENIRTAGIWAELADRVQSLLRERDRSLAESQHSLQDFLQALQASPNGVMLLDSQARIEWCNQTAAAHFGLDVSRDMLQAIVNLVRDPEFVRYLAGRDYQHSMTMPGRDSSISKPVVLSVNLHPYGEGRMMMLSRDITVLEQAEAMRRDFVANVSHEIRTPLTVLAGFIETLQTLNLDEPERQNYLALMAQQSDRMQTLVSDLLTLSRLEGSPPPGLEVWTPIPQMLRQIRQDALALSQLVTAVQGRQHQFVFGETYAGQIAGVASELLSAMGNLVSNAIRYTPAGGRIEVHARPLPDGRLEFSVADTGPGIAPEHLGRLTERFYRVDRSRSRETGGTGLGLAIVKHVVQRHGAHLAIESTLGRGSTFRITFPAERIKPLG